MHAGSEIILNWTFAADDQIFVCSIGIRFFKAAIRRWSSRRLPLSCNPDGNKRHDDQNGAVVITGCDEAQRWRNKSCDNGDVAPCA